MARYPTAAIIGAGSSGTAAAEAPQERGVPFTVFEAPDRVGGNWVFGSRNGMTAAADRRLHINTARDRMQYSDLRDLERERRAGAQQARAAGFPLRVVARGAAHEARAAA